MKEMGDYIYVGTGRNIVFNVLNLVFDIPVEDIPEAFMPKPGIDNNTEIWRYKKDGSEGWLRVFKADPKDVIYGTNWSFTNQGLSTGDSTRSMIEHNGEL